MDNQSNNVTVKPFLVYFYGSNDGNLNGTTGTPTNNDPIPNFIDLNTQTTSISST